MERLVVAVRRVARRAALLPASVNRALRARSVVDATTDAMYGIDGAGRIIFANTAVHTVLGIRPDALLGRHHHAAMAHGRPDGTGYGPDRCRICNAVEQADGSQIADDTLGREDGDRFAVELSASPVARRGSRAGAVVTFRDLTDRTSVTRRALHDPTTGLPNRALLQDHLDRAIARQERHGGLIGVLFLDLDRFMVVNDLLGHAAGDELLVEVAARLRLALREHDAIARFSGDEFVVLCDDLTDEAQVITIAERVVGTLAEPHVIAGQEVHSSASVGVVIARRQQGVRVDPGLLLANADQAMHLAKQAGGNGFELFDEQLRHRAQGRMEVERDLRRALTADELEVHYQPKVDLRDGTIIGVEALARWTHPTRGTISPVEFIPIAEESGLIYQLGLQVLETACRQSQVWRATRTEWDALLISVNLSGRQLQQPTLVADIAAVLARTGVAPDRVILEITESVLMTDISLAVAVLEALKGIGVQIAVDDFGTGYSSLAYLTRFPVDILKVDRSFVDGIIDGGQSRSIVSAVVGLAKALGLHTVAEGVEHPAQIVALRDLGCELAQGFHLARPMPASQIEATLIRGVPWDPVVALAVVVDGG